ncbi:MAG: hypothetical protein M1825_003837 [Sarcosagium campestre]|nr:MAG: hypothetical protein M1825_003837 [Sarcosagium campestre]
MTRSRASSTDSDAVLAALEAETEESSSPALQAHREARLQQLASNLRGAQTARASGYGEVHTLDTEQAALDATTQHPRVVLHFFHDEFARCAAMDGHLRLLARAHLDTRFCRLEVRGAPWLTEKLGVRVLPCVIGFVDAVSVGRVVGFEGLGAGDSFDTATLEQNMLSWGVLLEEKLEPGEGWRPETRAGGKGKQQLEDEDEGDDWD